MTHETGMPPEPCRLERALLASRADPDAEMKSRVMSRVGRELAWSRSRDLLQYVAGVAAAVLLMLNLSLSTARTASPPAPGMEPEQVRAACDEVRRLGVDLPGQEIARQCVLLAAGRDLPMYQEPYGSLSPVESPLK